MFERWLDSGDWVGLFPELPKCLTLRNSRLILRRHCGGMRAQPPAAKPVGVRCGLWRRRGGLRGQLFLFLLAPPLSLDTHQPMVFRNSYLPSVVVPPHLQRSNFQRGRSCLTTHLPCSVSLDRITTAGVGSALKKESRTDWSFVCISNGNPVNVTASHIRNWNGPFLPRFPAPRRANTNFYLRKTYVLRLQHRLALRKSGHFDEATLVKQ
jgi:hypothetical protein